MMYGKKNIQTMFYQSLVKYLLSPLIPFIGVFPSSQNEEDLEGLLAWNI